MHLLAAQPGTADDGSEAVDLAQDPASLVAISAADTELAALAAARRELGEGFPGLRLANLLQLGHPMSVDLYVDNVVAGAELVVLRLLGGANYWRYGLDRVVETCRANGIALAVLPGDSKHDDSLEGYSTVSAEARARLWAYFGHGGGHNAANLLRYAAGLTGRDWPADPPEPLAPAGVWDPWAGQPTDLASLRAHWETGQAAVAIVFYRALLEGAATAPVAALAEALAARGLAPLPIYTTSLKDSGPARTVAATLEAGGADVVLNATGFAVAKPGGNASGANPLTVTDAPVIQTIFAGFGRQSWRDRANGLGPRDVAMNVALPEVDGRLIGRAVSFKEDGGRDPLTQCPLATYEPEPGRIAYTADLAAAWAGLRRTPAAERRFALVLPNYPSRDGRLANGVGLDTPEAAAVVLHDLAEQGYDLSDLPADGAQVIARLQAGPTNAEPKRGADRAPRLPLDVYRAAFAELPTDLQDAITAQWGAPEADPFYTGEGFAIPAVALGNAVLALQPARGYDRDPAATYHDPALVPPHGYLAFYVWLKRAFGAQAVIHLGKHGNLEWLPGKALALSESCYPEAVFGATPHLYPFIVNDPGEGTQAKRRSAAAILDHLVPPLTRAETYGPLAELERLIDEYYQAASQDARRARALQRDILDAARAAQLDREVGIGAHTDEATALTRLDAYLCELKEQQIRGGLHIYGRAPAGEPAIDLLVAVARVPRTALPDGKPEPAGESLLRALARDLGLGDFDPLDPPEAAPWDGTKPAALAELDPSPWRHSGDTLERLELLAKRLIAAGQRPDPAAWPASAPVLAWVLDDLAPRLAACGEAELAGLRRGLAGRFVPPGPSGAPSRGRASVLPTGRNFYSVDSRAIPTPAAWRLGWHAAEQLLTRYRQDHGEDLQRLAMSVWGTANMRTGGDDIAQILALLGVRPTWDGAGGRVTGFEIVPAELLARPRVDVTVRMSGFFRDAFPAQVALLDSAIRAVAELAEPAATNPLAAEAAGEAAMLEGQGETPEAAWEQAATRVFGSKPGAYGAGLQALIDSGAWERREQLGEAFIGWGGYAYGRAGEGVPAQAGLRRRLAATQAVLHNQDNREHDILDSDDYYQFEGGLSAAVLAEAGVRPAHYHGDHSRPHAPRVRALSEEIDRVVRARAANPKWLRAMMAHGYKGAFEIAATVDYLFAFAATTGQAADRHFDQCYNAYLADPEVRDFLAAANPEGLAELAGRFQEAIARGLWQPSSNAAPTDLARLSGQGDSIFGM